jgi:hypothetical protein
MNLFGRLRAWLDGLVALVTRRGRRIRRTPRPQFSALPDVHALSATAGASGRNAARSGMFDQWSFEEVVFPYLGQLRAERDTVIGQIREQAPAMDEWDRAQAREARAQAAGLASRRQYLELQQAEATAHQQAAWARINRQARLEARLQELRDLSGLATAALAARYPGPSAADVECDTEEEADAAQHSQVADDELGAITLPGGPPADLGWEGPHGPRITGRWAMAILGGLVLVEVPIQYIIFQYFHGYTLFEEALTWIFTIPVSAVMVLLPHLAGWWYRSRTGTGSDRLLRAVPLLLLVPWAFLAVVLGYLRARVLLSPPQLPPETSSTSYLNNVHVTSNAATLHVTPTTMAIMFSALILGIGGIGFLLGLAREHPFAGAYSGATARRDALDNQLGQLAPPSELAERRAAGTGDPDGASASELRIETIRAAYATAELSYLNGIANAAGDPATTEAVSRMSMRIAAEAGSPLTRREDRIGMP